ncbi:MAG: hypothetical protein ACM3S4_13945 [Burkholderiales bacterium]
MEKSQPLSANFKLNVPDSVKKILDERMLDIDDIKQVVMHAENTGEKIMNTETRRFISHLAIGNVTCWAEYSVSGGEYTLHNAYFHRVSISEE